MIKMVGYVAYSAPVALVYYMPVIVIVYFLLYRMNSKKSFYAAVAISIATLNLAAASFLAGLNNFIFTSPVLTKQSSGSGHSSLLHYQWLTF